MAAVAQEKGQDKALEFKGRMTTLTVVRVLSPELDAITEQLQVQMGRAGAFFRDQPLLLELAEGAADARDVVELLRRQGLCPVALTVSAPGQEALAREAGLGIVREAPGVRKAAPAEPEPAPAAVPAPRPRAATRIVTRPVRSGQQIYARDADLVVLASVGAGAEVIADGCVHIYGTLRGRALAGAQGEKTARIFCRELQAELLSVAGTYTVSEDIRAAVRGRAAQIFLEGESLKIDALDS
jgi:septum site-determining protein MinC